MFWNPPGVANVEARHLFSIRTCNRCHAGETATSFVHIAPRAAGSASAISTFLSGGATKDPVSGTTRTFGDLERRKRSFSNLLCRIANAQPDDAPMLTRTH